MDARDQIRTLLVQGDNRLKQGHDARSLERARASYEKALALAIGQGLESEVRPLVEVRLADLTQRNADAAS